MDHHYRAGSIATDHYPAGSLAAVPTTTSTGSLAAVPTTTITVDKVGPIPDFPSQQDQLFEAELHLLRVGFLLALSISTVN
jgi:hypothetical protein